MSTRGSSRWRTENYGAHCKSPRTKINFAGMPLYVNTHAVEAFKVLGNILVKHGYKVDKKQTGCYNCRSIKGGNAWSSHSWALAIDVNWNDNPYGKKLVTNIPRAALKEISEVKTQTGHRVFKWGGDWDNRPETRHSVYDAMHFEIYATPRELKSGIIGAPQEDLDMISRGERSTNVTYWQILLKNKGYYDGKLDGDFGPKTETAVKMAQDAANLPLTGVIDLTTGASLSEGQGGSAALPKSVEATIQFKG